VILYVQLKAMIAALYEEDIFLSASSLKQTKLIICNVLHAYAK